MKSPETRNSLGMADTLRGDTILIQSKDDQRKESHPLALRMWGKGMWKGEKRTWGGGLSSQGGGRDSRGETQLS
jgi:hypothetical protein